METPISSASSDGWVFRIRFSVFRYLVATQVSCRPYVNWHTVQLFLVSLPLRFVDYHILVESTMITSPIWRRIHRNHVVYETICATGCCVSARVTATWSRWNTRSQGLLSVAYTCGCKPCWQTEHFACSQVSVIAYQWLNDDYQPCMAWNSPGTRGQRLTASIRNYLLRWLCSCLPASRPRGRAQTHDHKAYFLLFTRVDVKLVDKQYILLLVMG